MAARKIRPILAEIVEALDGIEAATAGKEFGQFQSDWLLRHGIQRGIEIISEAARHLPSDLLALEPQIPWKQIRGIGNMLRHEYHRISDSIVWAVVTEDLPPLRRAIERIQISLDASGIE
ncbi:HepT-like ribonuclease domain-containing protein [Chelativorans alearense]|uniref:HepT-like ribonuclease domain-containing protein n=1 Tax=Chelativorans alearense TaxID=2681495 RepID=UPI0013D280E0|nr:HepT-like ribonuclease domain-containing protein [Chelativorans alearense]